MAVVVEARIVSPGVVRDTIRQEGLSGRDIAVILHVSAQRVSQLLKSFKTPVH